MVIQKILRSYSSCDRACSSERCCYFTGYKRSSRKVEVKFVDYGNSEDVAETDLRPMLEKFMRLPPQACHCALALPARPPAPWTAQDIDRFHDVVDNATDPFHVSVSPTSISCTCSYRGARPVCSCSVLVFDIFSPR